MNQPLSFLLLAGGGVLLVSGFTGQSLADVVSGRVKGLPSKSTSLGPGSSDLVTSAHGAGYVNPLAKAHVTPERIDMGVDYAGTGQLVAVGNARVTQVNKGGWGKYGDYIEYQLLDGPLAGRYVFYAEGVTPQVKVGQLVPAGGTIATLIPGWHSGIEIGFGSGKQNTPYAKALGGGYSEGQLTAAGKAFSDFIAELGAAPGTSGGRPTVGSFK